MVVGIDIGTRNLGIVIVNPDNYKIFYMNNLDIKSLSDFYHYFIILCKKYKIKTCVYEGIIHRNFQITKNLSKIIAIIELVCEIMNIKVYEIHPSYMKKTLTGNGKAEKEEIKEKVNNFFKTNIENEHICDALGLVLTIKDLGFE